VAMRSASRAANLYSRHVRVFPDIAPPGAHNGWSLTEPGSLAGVVAGLSSSARHHHRLHRHHHPPRRRTAHPGRATPFASAGPSWRQPR
jgi:hypothetical protein